MIIKNWKIIKEWYNICWKWFKDLEEFYNLTWELANWDLWDNNCKFIDISSGFKYSWYYIDSHFYTDSHFYKDDIHLPTGYKYYISWDYFTVDSISWNVVILKSLSNKIIKAKIKYFNTDYGKSFLLYRSWNIVKVVFDWEMDWDRTVSYKTFLNWKEVK